MRYQNPSLQDELAASFVLGNLRGAARRRLMTLMPTHPGLRDRVAQWEEMIFPLFMRAPRVAPPARVWRAIRARTVSRSATGFSLGDWFGLWRIGTAGFAAAALAALVYFAAAPQRAPALPMVAVLNDARAQPSILVSWAPGQDARRQLAVRIVAHPSMPMGTSWQAWAVPRPGAAPVSLGFITGDEIQRLEVSAAAAEVLRENAVVGVSVEAEGGSASGRPSGPFLFEGTLLRIGT